MRKPFIRGFPIYALFLANFVYAAQHGFHWLFYVAAALTLVMLALDILEVISRHGGRKKKKN